VTRDRGGHIPEPAELTTIRERLAQHAGEIDRANEFPAASVNLIREAGLLGLAVPIEYGGPGADLRTLASVARFLGAGCLSTSMIWAMHTIQVCVLANFAVEALKERVLPKIAKGEVLIGSITTEARISSDLLHASSPMRHDGSTVGFCRVAPVVTGGDRNDAFLMTMRWDEDAATSDVTMLYVESDQAVVKRISDWNAHGLRGTYSVGLEICGDVPVEQVVIKRGAFPTVAVGLIAPVAHILWSAAWLGGAQGALTSLLASFRRAGSARILLQSDHRMVALGEIRSALDAVSGCLTAVVSELEALGTTQNAAADTSFAIHVNGLKTFAAHTLADVMTRTMEFAGARLGYHVDDQVPIERTLRDLRAASLMYSNTTLNRESGTLWLGHLNAELLGATGRGLVRPSGGGSAIQG
jgi:acyl-CoA dehydrogenase